jgi:heme-degrading monooxygenase HmoA
MASAFKTTPAWEPVGALCQRHARVDSDEGRQPLILRIWRARIDADRISEYEEFAQNQSVPMFRKQRGFAGVFLTRRTEDVAVISLWNSREDVAALGTSTSYASTVAALDISRLVTGEVSVETFDVHAGEFDGKPIELRSGGAATP